MHHCIIIITAYSTYPANAKMANLSGSLNSLHISPSPTPTALKKKPNREEPVDDWETADLSSEDDEVGKLDDEFTAGFNPPPPTPTSPIHSHRRGSSATLGIGSPTPRTPIAVVAEEKTERPTTTDAVARRMISAALGVRTKSTVEQREFDSAVREKEKKRKEEEKERKREEEKKEEEAKRKIWED
ncbi:hypothetical protein BDD12DRAFT_423426 [Trichophaea hybrida]|nr:hypothetical protein BDD12DRAFT_423426 [Trichophaea hybrida]